MNAQHTPTPTMLNDAAPTTARRRWVATAALILLPPAVAVAAAPAISATPVHATAVTIEAIPGSSSKRVILSTASAQRLGIETGKVGEESIVRKQMVSGLIVNPVDKQPEQKPGGGSFGGFGQANAGPPKPGNGAAGSVKVPAVVPVVLSGGLEKLAVATPNQAPAKPVISPLAGALNGVAVPPPASSSPIHGDAWVQVTLSPGELDRLTKDKPARLLALSTREKLGDGVFAQPTGMAPVEDTKRSMLTIYYVVPGQDHGLVLNRRVRVELPFSGNEEKQKTVPYSAVYYDGKGTAWVYVNTKPLTYERQRIAVDRVMGDTAVLSDGPAVGTSIVTVGASLLFGAEIFGK
jgi:hypothetical protein